MKKGKKKAGKATNPKTSKTGSDRDGTGSDSDISDIFTDEISEFTNARNNIDLDDKNVENSDEEEELFGLVDEDDESDEEIGEWAKRLKQVKFQAKLEKKKALPDVLEKSWGNKRSDFYGSGVRRKPKQVSSDEEDEWIMEEKEMERLQQKLDEDIDADLLMPSFIQNKRVPEDTDLTVERSLSQKESEEMKQKLHPEAEPLRLELSKCMEELEKTKGKKGWMFESRDTCFRLLAANIAFYLYLIENDEDCRGHPVLKRIIEWKRLAKMYEAVPLEDYSTAEDDRPRQVDASKPKKGTQKKTSNKLAVSGDEPLAKKARAASQASDDDDEEDEDDKDNEDDSMDSLEEVEGESPSQGELENRPVTYEIEKNKPKVKTKPNNPRVKHREKFRKAKIRRKGKIREYRPEIQKYQGEASGIRAGIVRSVRLH